MHVLHTPDDFYTLKKACLQNQTLALVPTMGALHDGHLALIRHAKTLCGFVVVSIFVNPLQFGENEDFAHYPRPLADDLAACNNLGVDAVFTPSTETLYPNKELPITRVCPPDHLTNRLCGLDRPGHFDGMATVVLKLLQIFQPSYAIFGEKDAQQLAIIRHMVHDFNLTVAIVGHPVVRDPSGLALSSRNQYLKTSEAKHLALLLYKTLLASQMAYQENLRNNNTDPPAAAPLLKTAYNTVYNQVMAEISQNTIEPGFAAGDCSKQVVLHYLEAVDAETCLPVEALRENTRLVMAATVFGVRLIDTLALS
ncbi:MAG: pantoate--beta-alanine ligase [Cyanobacteria bacterium P01_H01_bin.74]